MQERRSIATGELNDAMKSIVQLPTTTKNGTPRRWQVPVDINELSRLDNALSAAKLNGVESKLVLDGKRLMRTKRAEARLAMLYAACEQREDPAVWVKCKHALELDPALGGMLPHLYRAYDEAVAEYADAKLISDVQAMKLQLAQHKADISRQKEEERIREAQRAKEAEQEHEMMHHYTLRKIARCELDTSRAFHRLSSKDKRNKGSGQPAVTTLDTISDTDTGACAFAVGVLEDILGVLFSRGSNLICVVWRLESVQAQTSFRALRLIMPRLGPLMRSGQVPRNYCFGPAIRWTFVTISSIGLCGITSCLRMVQVNQRICRGHLGTGMTSSLDCRS